MPGLDKFFVPGLRKAGDFRAGAVFAPLGKLLLHNAGPEFPSDWVTASAQAGGSTADVRTNAVSDAELLAWITPEMPRGRPRARRRPSQ